ncbi:MAG: beta-lactamase family protein [Proteobacteria bacterium]|nr:beta-lactamase family protein [Pseudomonadota bacterium]
MIALPPIPELQTRVRTARGVTRSADEAETRVKVDAIWSGVEQLYESGLYPAIGLNIRHRGEVILDRTIGHVDNPPEGEAGAVATPQDTLFGLFSASKLLTALLVHALHEDGLLHVDDFVCSHLPGFERHGKHGIRIRHLLSHTAGIPDMPADIDAEAVIESGALDVEDLFDLRPQSAPGRRNAYHAVTAFQLLAGICERASGVELRELARRRLLAPLGFEHMCYGVGAQDYGRVAKHYRTGPPIAPMMKRIFERSIGIDVDRAVELSNSEKFLSSVIPSANVCTTGREMTRFLQLLLNGGELDGTRVLRPETIARATTASTGVQLDGTFGFPMRYSLGMMMGGNRFSLFGLTTRGAFGHLGFSNVVVYGDPSRDLAVSFLNTGKPMLAPGMVRWYWVLQQIALAVPRK